VLSKLVKRVRDLMDSSAVKTFSGKVRGCETHLVDSLVACRGEIRADLVCCTSVPEGKMYRASGQRPASDESPRETKDLCGTGRCLECARLIRLDREV
jgi:hypothetical protein